MRIFKIIAGIACLVASVVPVILLLLFTFQFAAYDGDLTDFSIMFAAAVVTAGQIVCGLFLNRKRNLPWSKKAKVWVAIGLSSGGLMTWHTAQNFIRARSTTATEAALQNTRRIEAARQQWDMENQKASQAVTLVKVSDGLPAWVSNSVLKLMMFDKHKHTRYQVGEGMSGIGTEFSLNRLNADRNIGGTAGQYGLKTQWLAANTNGFEVVFVRSDNGASGWTEETNVILFPYQKEPTTNQFGGWVIIGQFK